jgi:NADH-quinone oxidoreductase subunit M
MLWTLQRVFLGTIPDKWKSLPDINGRELFTLIPLAIIVIFLGIYPSPAINLMTSAVNTLVSVLNQNGGAMLLGQ